MIADFYIDGYNRIQEEDAESQKNFLATVCELREMPLISFKGFFPIFIPNDQYLVEFMGKQVRLPEYGLYSDDACIWSNQLLFPMFNAAKKVKGFASFDPFAYISVHQENGNENYYNYSAKSVMMKSKYLFGSCGCYERALDDGVLFLTDGMFDTISVSEYGFNCMALMGSVISEEVAMQLRFINKIVLLMDNDDAGLKLAAGLKRIHRNVEVLKQGYAKDVDAALKSADKDLMIGKLTKCFNESTLQKKNSEVCSTTSFFT